MSLLHIAKRESFFRHTRRVKMEVSAMLKIIQSTERSIITDKSLGIQVLSGQRARRFGVRRIMMILPASRW